MSDAIVYVDISEVREGALDELKAGLKDLVDFIEANEPRLIATTSISAPMAPG
jgi:hypothetical protein